MNSDERKQRIRNLYNRQNDVFNSSIALSDNSSLWKNNLSDLHPRFVLRDFTVEDLGNISAIKALDESIFAKWRTADLPIMFISGILGTFSSVLLKDFFAGLHDNVFGSTGTLDGGHSGEGIDWVPGNKQPGGFGHRWLYGHDALNPFEVDWDQYLQIAKSSGTTLPPWLKAVFYWVRHLLQDTFSKEGLPLPGHSLFRGLLNPTNPHNRELLQFLGTIKMRDVVGTGLTNIIMGGYLWGTERDIRRVVTEPNYRAFSLMLGANLVTLFSGLLVPPPSTSFNWPAIPIIAYYSIQLFRLERKVRSELAGRTSTLKANDRVLFDQNDAALKNYCMINDSNYEELLKYEEEINKAYKEALAKHQETKLMVYKRGTV